MGLVLLPHTSAKAEIYILVLGAVSAVTTYAYKEASRRTTTHDVLIGDLMQKLCHLLIAQKASTRGEGFDPKPILAFLSGIEFATADAYRNRLDDALRMPTRYIAAAYSELAYQKARFDAKSDASNPDSNEVRLAAYLMLKRIFLAVRGIADYDEKDGLNALKIRVDAAVTALQDQRLGTVDFEIARQFVKSAIHLAKKP